MSLEGELEGCLRGCRGTQQGPSVSREMARPVVGQAGREPSFMGLLASRGVGDMSRAVTGDSTRVL